MYAAEQGMCVWGECKGGSPVMLLDLNRTPGSQYKRTPHVPCANISRSVAQHFLVPILYFFRGGGGAEGEGTNLKQSPHPAGLDLTP